MLILIKSIHTAIWAILASTVLYVFWSGTSGNITLWSWLAVLAVLAEGVVLLLFKGRCPLTVMARKYSDSPKDNFDIFLPNWLARYNKQIFTLIFAAGLLLMGVRML